MSRTTGQAPGEFKDEPSRWRGDPRTPTRGKTVQIRRKCRKGDERTPTRGFPTLHVCASCTPCRVGKPLVGNTVQIRRTPTEKVWINRTIMFEKLMHTCSKPTNTVGLIKLHSSYLNRIAPCGRPLVYLCSYLCSVLVI